MPSLYTLITEDAKFIEEELDRLEAEGVPYQEAVEQAVARVDAMTADKALNYARVILNLESFATAASERAKAMAARGQARQAAADRLRQRMTELLPSDFKAEDEEVKLRFQATKKVDDSQLTGLDGLPAELVRVVPERKELNKAAALKALKGGEEYAGLKLVESLSVRIS